MKKFYLFTISLLLSFSLLAQINCLNELKHEYSRLNRLFSSSQNFNSKLELKKYLSNAKECKRVNIDFTQEVNFMSFITIASFYASLNFYEEALSNYHDAISVTNKMHDDKKRAFVYQHIASVYYDTYKSDSCVKYLNKACSIYEKTNDTINVVACNHLKVKLHNRNGEFLTSINLLNNCLLLTDSIVYPTDYATILNSLGYTFFLKEDYSQSLKFYQRSKSIYTNNYDLNNLMMIHQQLSGIYSEMGFYKKALKESQENNLLSFQNANSEYYASSTENIASILFKLNRKKESEEYHLKAKKLFHKLKDYYGVAIADLNLSEIYNDLGEYETAEALLIESSSLTRSNDFKDLYGDISLTKSKIKFNLNQIDSAFIYANEAIKLSRIYNVKLQIKDVHYLISDLYEQKKNYKEALFYRKKGELLFDSLKSVDVKKNLQELILSYDSEIKDERIKANLTEIENIKLKNNEIEQENYFVWTVLVLFLFIISLVVMFSILKSKKKQADLSLMQMKLKLEREQKENARLKIDKLKANIIELNECINVINQSRKDDMLNENYSVNILDSLSSNDDWAKFFIEFNLLFDNYLSLLKAKHQKLTKNDMRLVALIKLNLNDKEMATLLNIEYPSLRKAKARLKVKLGIGKDINLAEYIS